MYTFEKESVLPASDPRSPYYVNLPSYDSKPIDNLVSFFKYWKYFVKSLIYYLKEISLVKEFEANLNQQLINSVQFPGYKDLPAKLLSTLESHLSPNNSQNSTPVKELNRSLSSVSLSTTPTNSSNTGSEKRPHLFKTKSNNSFLKHGSQSQMAPLNSGGGNMHKRNVSMTSLSSKPTSLPSPPITHHVNDIKVPPHFFPNNSLFNSFPPLLVNHHSQIFISQLKLHKEITNKLVPRLENLLKNLLMKIKEIKSSLKNDSFANPDVIKEVSKTGKVLDTFMNSVERYSAKEPLLKKQIEAEEEEDRGVLEDPFLIKLQVDYQVKHQLLKENYLFASYVNLQNISKDLFTYVLKELNFVVDKFGKLLNSEDVYLSDTDSIVNLYLNLKRNVSTSSLDDWEYFIAYNPNLLNTYKDTPVSAKRSIRTFKDIVLPYAGTVHTKCIRYGVLYKKSKVLKNYSSFFYVLTCNYLHEFKIDGELQNSLKKKEKDKIGGFIGHDDIPVKSYNLNEYSLKLKSEKEFKFFLIKNSNPNCKVTLKCINLDDYTDWFNDLYELLKFGSDHYQRFSLVEEKTLAKQQSATRDKIASHNKAPPPSNGQTSQNNFISHLSQNSHDSLSSGDSQTSSSRPSGQATKDTKNTDSQSQNRASALKLNLKNSHPRGIQESLTGIFTPKIKTPVQQSPGEKNPFDQHFMKDIPTSAASPNLSPTETAFPDRRSSHEEEHENYLQIQKEFLKQQQEILNLKIKEQQLILHQQKQQQQQEAINSKLREQILNQSSKSSPNLDASNDISLLSRTSSGESINSFQPTSNVQMMLNSNRDLLNHSHDKRPSFTLNDDDSSTTAIQDVDRNPKSDLKHLSTSDLPTVLISSDH
ncbi:uncharacterized protein PRCAT00002551001 [Priceomyces carsonii]|uniref:uncharacterized protein n=1 Tax=Priceomyces carsonii TaxID=28549 RepID=UPI002ED8F56D|nr:unnamed protein product [Priceomyces carsonii]